LIHAGEYSYGSPRFATYHTCDVYIGKFVGFAENVSIDTGGEHNTGVISTFPFHHFPMFQAAVAGAPLNSALNKGDVVIGNDVWIAEGVRILTGVTIGDGAVIGSRALVCKDIPPYAIAVGIPAKVIRYRFSQDVIEKLLKIKWWDWPIEKILKHAKILVSNDVEALFQAAGV
jgi:acetyltransferase-like isoleucine patch superfamily enzyme